MLRDSVLNIDSSQVGKCFKNQISSLVKLWLLTILLRNKARTKSETWATNRNECDVASNPDNVAPLAEGPAWFILIPSWLFFAAVTGPTWTLFTLFQKLYNMVYFTLDLYLRASTILTYINIWLMPLWGATYILALLFFLTKRLRVLLRGPEVQIDGPGIWKYNPPISSPML